MISYYEFKFFKNSKVVAKNLKRVAKIKNDRKMKKSSIIGIVIVSFVLVVVYSGMGISYNNKEINIRKEIAAQQIIYGQNFDKQYKIIAQLAEVAERNVEANKEAFKEIYPDLIEGRYSKDNGTLMKWVQESNPQWDMKAIGEIYAKVSVAIEAQREDLFTQAKRLTDLVRERETLIEQPISGFFIKNKEKIDVALISSKKTKEALKTGEDNDIDLFKKGE